MRLLLMPLVLTLRLALVLTLLSLFVACARPTPAGTPTPAPPTPEVRTLPGRGVAIRGAGNTATDALAPDFNGGLSIGIQVVTLTHDGRSTFVVSDVQDGQREILTSAVGAYSGQRPLVVT